MLTVLQIILFLTKKIINIGGRLCSLSKIECCSTKSVSKFTSDLASVVFEKHELAASCISGKKCNADKRSDNPTLPKLDPKCVEAILSKGI